MAGVHHQACIADTGPRSAESARFSLCLFARQAELPVNPATLRYGTADGGATVLNVDDELAEKLKQAAKKLNLRPHFIKGKVRT